MRKFRIALVQMLVKKDKQKNIKNAVDFIRKAAENNSKIVVLPEYFNSPIVLEQFANYSEEIPKGETSQELAKVAKELGIYIVGGSITEKDGDRVYNTCPIFDPKGELITKHRKMHLFDVDIPNKIVFKESLYIFPGDSITMFDTPFCKIGVGVCHDLRFPEIDMIYQQYGCSLILYPAAFNVITGKEHFELLIRSKAVDNQLYVAGIAPARDNNAEFVTWGHSTCFDPFGELVASTNENEDIVYADIGITNKGLFVL